MTGFKERRPWRPGSGSAAVSRAGGAPDSAGKTADRAKDVHAAAEEVYSTARNQISHDTKQIFAAGRDFSAGCGQNLTGRRAQLSLAGLPRAAEGCGSQEKCLPLSVEQEKDAPSCIHPSAYFPLPPVEPQALRRLLQPRPPHHDWPCLQEHCRRVAAQDAHGRGRGQGCRTASHTGARQPHGTAARPARRPHKPSSQDRRDTAWHCLPPRQPTLHPVVSAPGKPPSCTTPHPILCIYLRKDGTPPTGRVPPFCLIFILP